MITKEENVGPRGDCIIAVKADRSVSEIDRSLKRMLLSGSPIIITLRAGGQVEKVRARGHPSLALNHKSDIVVRKSCFICGRTLAIGADKAAADLSKKFVDALKNPATELVLEVEADAGGSP
jgi:hypothetical protein